MRGERKKNDENQTGKEAFLSNNMAAVLLVTEVFLYHAYKTMISRNSETLFPVTILAPALEKRQ